MENENKIEVIAKLGDGISEFLKSNAVSEITEENILPNNSK